MCLSIIWLNGMVFPEKPFLLPARFFRVLFEMVTMPFPCNGLLLCCVNLPKCSSKNLLVVLSLISIFWGDGLALALNSFWWFTYIVSWVVFLFIFCLLKVLGWRTANKCPIFVASLLTWKIITIKWTKPILWVAIWYIKKKKKKKEISIN